MLLNTQDFLLAFNQIFKIHGNNPMIYIYFTIDSDSVAALQILQTLIPHGTHYSEEAVRDFRELQQNLVEISKLTTEIPAVILINIGASTPLCRYYGGGGGEDEWPDFSAGVNGRERRTQFFVLDYHRPFDCDCIHDDVKPGLTNSPDIFLALTGLESLYGDELGVANYPYHPDEFNERVVLPMLRDEDGSDGDDEANKGDNYDEENDDQEESNQNTERQPKVKRRKLATKKEAISKKAEKLKENNRKALARHYAGLWFAHPTTLFLSSVVDSRKGPSSFTVWMSSVAVCWSWLTGLMDRGSFDSICQSLKTKLRRALEAKNESQAGQASRREVYAKQDLALPLYRQLDIQAALSMSDATFHALGMAQEQERAKMNMKWLLTASLGEYGFPKHVMRSWLHMEEKMRERIQSELVPKMLEKGWGTDNGAFLHYTAFLRTLPKSATTGFFHEVSALDVATLMLARCAVDHSNELHFSLTQMIAERNPVTLCRAVDDAVRVRHIITDTVRVAKTQAQGRTRKCQIDTPKKRIIEFDLYVVSPIEGGVFKSNMILRQLAKLLSETPSSVATVSRSSAGEGKQQLDARTIVVIVKISNEEARICSYVPRTDRDKPNPFKAVFDVAKERAGVDLFYEQYDKTVADIPAEDISKFCACIGR